MEAAGAGVGVGGTSVLRGHCYCEQVSWETSADSSRAMYCHCDSCRRAHSAPVYHVAYVETSSFRITKGAELIKSFGKANPQLFSRHFCSNCGTHTHNTLMRTPPMIGLFPSTFDEPNHKIFAPACHLFCKEAVVDLDVCFNDGLKRYDGDRE